MRYRDMDRIDLDAAREKVRTWMTTHPDGTPDQMTDDLKGEYQEFADDMAIVLRGLMAASRITPKSWPAPHLPGSRHARISAECNIRWEYLFAVRGGPVGGLAPGDRPGHRRRARRP